MDELVRILNELAELDNDEPTFELTNTSRIIRVEALTRGTYENPEEAFAAARSMADALLATDFVAVNSNEIGAQVVPFDDDGLWRGRIKLALWPRGSLTANHRVAVGVS